jgi:hypothetical protein
MFLGKNRGKSQNVSNSFHKSKNLQITELQAYIAVYLRFTKLPKVNLKMFFGKNRGESQNV